MAYIEGIDLKGCILNKQKLSVDETIGIMGKNVLVRVVSETVW